MSTEPKNHAQETISNQARNPFSMKINFEQAQKKLRKNPPVDKNRIKQELSKHFRFAESLGFPIASGARILDIGCGIGDSVVRLLELGFDAYGIDILELWDADFDSYWAECEKLQGDYLKRLRAVSASDYRLPFPDSYFDFAFSDQVFEHVFNYETVLSEIARVLKPNAISVHRFPGLNKLMEGHIFVPFPVLCHFRLWLFLWALLGKRSPRQIGFTWRDTLATNIDTMEYCNYLTKRKIRYHARNACVSIEFMEVKHIKNRAHGFGRVGRIMGATPPRCEALWHAFCR